MLAELSRRDWRHVVACWPLERTGTPGLLERGMSRGGFGTKLRADADANAACIIPKGIGNNEVGFLAAPRQRGGANRGMLKKGRAWRLRRIGLTAITPRESNQDERRRAALRARPEQRRSPQTLGSGTSSNTNGNRYNSGYSDPVTSIRIS